MTIFTKTAKGITQLNQRTQSLSRQATKVLKAIDGRSSVTILAGKADLAMPAVEKELALLKKEGFIRVFEVRIEVPISEFGGDDDFDFTAPARTPASQNQPVAAFGPSKLRGTGLGEQVPRATPIDEAEQIAAKLAERKQKEEDQRIAAEALAAARAAAQKAQAEARARAEREAQIRARLDVEAKARKDAEIRAIEEARRAEVAAAASRADLETKLAEESRKREELAHSTKRLTEEQQAQQVAAQKALSEARAKAEAEAKAFAAARNRIEIETRALSEARAQAEAAAKRQEVELASAQRELRTQLKAEIEAKVRAEMEALLTSDIEESGRAEVEAAVREEALDDARRQLEAQLTTERTSLAKIEAEAKQRAEIDAKRMLADQESRLRAEMEMRLAEIAAEKALVEIEARKMVEAQSAAAAAAAAEFVVRLKFEEDARRVAEQQAEERRRRDEVERQRREAQVRDEAVARAKATAEAKAATAAAAAMEERLQAARAAEVELESVQRARDEAEQRAARETKARKIASQAVADQVAEKEKLVESAERRIAEEREARERAEAKAYADERAEEAHRLGQIERLKELSEQAEHAANQPAVTVAGKRQRPKIKKEIPVGRLIVFSVVALLVLSVVAIQFVPLGTVNTKLEKALAAWVHDDVQSANLRIALFPKPHVKLEQVSMGKVADAKAVSGKLYMDLASIFGDKFVIETMELNDVSVASEALPRALKWASGENRGSQVEINRILLTNVKLDIKGVALEPFDAELNFDRKGALVRGTARTRDGKWSLETAVDKVAEVVEGTTRPWAVEFAARNWTPPIGARIPFAVLSGKGSWTDGLILFPELDAKLLEGSAKGNLKISMPGGANPNAVITAQSEFTVARIKVDELVGHFTRDIAVSGRMEGNFVATMSATTVAALDDAPLIVGNFLVRDGTMSNVDLVQAMRSPGNVGGQTKYAELTGKLRLNESILRLETLKLSGGVLFAGGDLGVTLGKGALSGTVNAELRSKVAQDRAVFSLSGTVARPVLKRG